MITPNPITVITAVPSSSRVGFAGLSPYSSTMATSSVVYKPTRTTRNPPHELPTRTERPSVNELSF